MSAIANRDLVGYQLARLDDLPSAFRPSSVPLGVFARNRSPVETCGIDRFLARNAACVPLPAPGGPTRTIRISGGTLRNYAAGAGSDLLHGLQADAHDDEDARPAEREVLVRASEACQRHRRDKSNQTQVQRARPSDSVEHVAQILGSRTTSPDARDEATILLHVVRDFLGVERNRGIKEGEEHDQQEVRGDVVGVVSPFTKCCFDPVFQPEVPTC